MRPLLRFAAVASLLLLTPAHAHAQAVTVPMNFTQNDPDRSHASDLHVSLSGQNGGSRARVAVSGVVVTTQPGGCGAPVITTGSGRFVLEWPTACVPMGSTVSLSVTYTTQPGGATVTTSRVTWTSRLRYENRPALTWDDFETLPTPPAGTPPGIEAEVSTNFGLRGYTPTTSPPAMANGKWQSTGSFTAASADAYMGTRGAGAFSWVEAGKNTAALLDHEQGHYDLSRIFALKLVIRIRAIQEVGTGDTKRDAVRDARAKRNAAANQASTSTHNEHQASQTRYDNQTNHGKIGAQQAAWRANINNCLAALNAAIGAMNWVIPAQCQNVC